MNTPHMPRIRAPRSTNAGWIAGLTLAVLATSLSGLVLLQLDRAGPLATAAPYRAPALDLILTGAVPATVSFASLDDFTEAKVTPSGFRFTTTRDAPLAFGLDFRGASEVGSQAFYDLSAGTYPLTLTLLGEGRVLQTFTAREGTVDLDEAGGSVSAFLYDEFGRQVFLSARFGRPEAL